MELVAIEMEGKVGNIFFSNVGIRKLIPPIVSRLIPTLFLLVFSVPQFLPHLSTTFEKSCRAKYTDTMNTHSAEVCTSEF